MIRSHSRNSRSCLPIGGSTGSERLRTAEYVRLDVDGWLGNRLGRSVNGGKLVNVAVFENMEKYNAWRASDEFVEHVEIIRPFVQEAAPGMYEILYSAGTIP